LCQLITFLYPDSLLLSLEKRCGIVSNQFAACCHDSPRLTIKK